MIRISFVYFGLNKQNIMTEVTTKIPFSEALDKALDGRPNRWLSERCGIHESDISKLRRGLFNPTQGQIDKIATALPGFTYSL